MGGTKIYHGKKKGGKKERGTGSLYFQWGREAEGLYVV